MQDKVRPRSFRLIVHQGSGRVRWCVGREDLWQSKVKRLVFLPAVLLTIFLISVLISYLVVKANGTKATSEGSIPGWNLSRTNSSYLPTT